MGTTELCGECWAAWRAELVAKHGVDRVYRVGEVVIVEREGGPVRGLHRPDHGPDQWELSCPICEASWVGNPMDGCAWCARRESGIVAAQRVLLLDGPRGGTDAEALRVWAQQLANAVRAGVLHADEARRVWRREVRRVA